MNTKERELRNFLSHFGLIGKLSNIHTSDSGFSITFYGTLEQPTLNALFVSFDSLRYYTWLNTTIVQIPFENNFLNLN